MHRMDNTNNLYSEDEEFAVPNTQLQESPATFSRNTIRRLGICRISSGTDTVNPNFNAQKDSITVRELHYARKQ